MNIVLDAYADYESGAEYTATRVGTGKPTYHEGLMMPDAHAVSYKVSGSAPGYLFSIGVDTQPRRIRYHVGSDN